MAVYDQTHKSLFSSRIDLLMPPNYLHNEDDLDIKDNIGISPLQ